MSRSLGTLTIDLVAKTAGFVQGMDKAERSSRKWQKQVKSDMESIKKVAKTSLAAVGVGIAGVSALMVKWSKDGLAAADAQNKMARSMNTSYDSLTALNHAFSDAGVDGYEASLNRLNRRLGAAEFGGGAAAKTVKALNLDLKELSSLNMDERVAAISDAIKDSGASAQLAARYAQDLGFEQKEATQFFLQGGDAIRAYSKNVDEFGQSISELDAVKIEMANDEFAKFSRLVDGIKTQLAVQVAPVLSAISQMLLNTAKDAGGVADGAESGFNAVIDGAAFTIDAVEGIRRTFQVLGKGITVFGLGATGIMLKLARDIIEFPTDATNGLIDLLNNIPYVDIKKFGMSDLGKRIDAEVKVVSGAIKEGINDINETLLKPLPGESFKRLVVDAKEAANDAAAEVLAANKKIAEDLITNNEDAVVSNEKLGDSYLAILGGYDEAIAIQNKYEAELKRIAESSASLEQQQELTALATAKMHEELAALEEQGYWQKWLEGAQESLSAFDEISKTVIDNFTSNFGNAFESVILDSQNVGEAMRGIGEAIIRGVVNAIGQMIAQWAVAAVVQKALGASATAAGVAQAGTLAAAWATPAALASLASFGGNAVPANAALIGTAAVSKGIALSGMAHDGIDSIPETGTWLLEKGERVTTAETSAKLDRQLDKIEKNEMTSNNVVNIYGAPEGTKVNERVDEMGRIVTDIILGDINSNGPILRGITSATGTTRRGR